MKSQLFPNRQRIVCHLTAIMACVLPAAADVTLAKVFTDNMMFQRKQPIRVWGTAEAGEEVSVALGKKSAKATTSAEGKWMAELPAVQVGDNLELAIKGKNTLSLKNIIIGDIWVCSGQSNMEMGLGGCLGAEEDIKAADFPKIRRIKFNHVQTPQPQAEAPTATAWQVCSPATAGGFTAAGFYFAREVMQKTGVPIGIIDSNWGGTRIEPWIAAEGLPLVEALKAANPGGFSGMYNGMIHPIIKLPIKGALWYQGESNGEEGQSYNDKMQALISGWRKQWGVGDFPFYFVQLANFQNPNQDPAGGNGWAKLREAQTKTLSVANTGMAVIIDTVTLPEAGDIHPKNKYDVGSRLAQWALAKDYGKKEVVFSGPIFKALKIQSGKALLAFDHNGGGLMIGKKTGRNAAVAAAGEKLKRFAIAGADKKWFWADAVIEKNLVVVSSPDVKEPVAVRYGYEMNPDGANLYNKEGLPASPFRTDDW